MMKLIKEVKIRKQYANTFLSVVNFIRLNIPGHEPFFFDCSKWIVPRERSFDYEFWQTS